MPWFEINSNNTTVDDFRSLARSTAASLSFAQRPSLREVFVRERTVVAVTPEGKYLYTTVENPHLGFATLTPCQMPAVLEDEWRLQHVSVPWSAILTRDPRESETAEPLRVSDGFVAVTLRKPGYFESKRVNDWVAAEFRRQSDTSKLVEAGSAVGRVTSGASTRKAAHNQAIAAATAIGMGLSTFKTHRSSPAQARLWVGILMLLVGAIGLLGGLSRWWWTVPVIGVLLTVWAIYAKTVFSPHMAVMVKPRHRWWLERKVRATYADNMTGMGVEQSGKKHKTQPGYALQRSSLLVTTGALTLLCMPDQNASVSKTTVGRAPKELTDTTGPVVGADSAGNPVRIPDDVMYGGVALLGEANSGKSNTIHAIVRQMRPTVLVDFEMKNDKAYAQLKGSIPELKLLRLSGCTPWIDMLAGLQPSRAGEYFSELLQAALGDTVFGARSSQQSADAVTIARSVSWERFIMRCAQLSITPPKHWLELAYRLLAGQGVSDARKLMAIAVSQDHSLLPASERLHGGISASGRPVLTDSMLTDRLSAPMNKFHDLMGTDVWGEKRAWLGWDDVFDHDGKIVIVMDSTDDGIRLIGSMLLTSLVDHIKASCADWQEQGKTITIPCDELSKLAGANGAAVTWLKDQGREFGVISVFGTQYPQQLPAAVMNCLLGFMTVISYALRNPDIGQKVAEVIGVGSEPGAWTYNRIASLPQHVMAIRSASIGGALPAAVVDAVSEYDIPA